MKRLIAVVALAIFAFPSGAVAMRIDAPRQDSPPAPRVAPHLPALGTDVAAPDQQSPVVSSAPVPVAGGSEFDWGDAGIGAGGALAVLALSLGSVVTLRRRVRRTAAIAG